MAWLLILVAGILEAGWVIGLKYADGFTRPLPSILTIIGIAASMLLLSIAARNLPIGTAYAVWVGIGTTGAVILGIFLFNDPATPLRMFFLTMLIASIIGLKAVS